MTVITPLPYTENIPGGKNMYKIGEKIVYPMHGAGIIEKIEERLILNERRKYYILTVPCNDMKIMIPVDKCEEIGVRPVIEKKEVNNILKVLGEPASKMSNNWNHRFRENMEKLKSSNLIDVAQVVRNLKRIDRERPLSTGEKKMLSNALQILVSELVFASDKSVEEVEKLVEETI